MTTTREEWVVQYLSGLSGGDWMDRGRNDQDQTREEATELLVWFRENMPQQHRIVHRGITVTETVVDA